MSIIKELSSATDIVPQVSSEKLIYNCFVEDNMKNKSEVISVLNWSDNYYRIVNMSLKDNLRKGVLNFEHKGITKQQSDKFQIMLKYTQAKTLIARERTRAGIQLIREALKAAEPYEMTLICLECCRELQAYHATHTLKRKQFVKYRDRGVFHLKRYNLENKAQLIYNNVSISIANNRGSNNAFEDLKKWDSKILYSYMEIVYFLSSVASMYSKLKEYDKVRLACEKAKTLLDGRKNSYVGIFSFQFKIAESFIAENRFDEAKIILDECLLLPALGSYHWNIVLVKLAEIGLKTKDFELIKKSWGKSKSEVCFFKGEVIDRYWEYFMGEYEKHV